eukprot:jgi/Chrzof1/1222/Cz01g45090.t1
MAATNHIPLVTMGKHVELVNKVADYLAPTYKVQSWTGEVNQLRAVIQAAPEQPRGLLIGGGFTDDEAEQGAAVIKEINPSAKVVRVTPGTIEKVGPAGVAQWIKQQLDAHHWTS